MNNTITHEESILTDIEKEVSAEQPNGSESEDLSGDVQTKGMTKHVLKTNQSLGDYGDLMSHLLTPEKIDEIRDENPKLAERLAKSKRFGKHFQDSDQGLEDDDERIRRIANEVVGSNTKESRIEDAKSRLTVGGKRLNPTDLNLISSDESFNQTLNGFLNAGASPQKAVQKAFNDYLSEKHPQKVSSMTTSFLSASSEHTARKPDTAVDKFAKQFNDPQTLPKFLRKAKKKNLI
jgi:hypothetical protein